MSTSTRLRAIILSFSIVLALVLFGYEEVYGNGIATLVTVYALLAAGFLYLTLFITPLITLFPNVPFKGLLIWARRPLGVSAAMFASTHAYIAFFDQLGGFAGLPYLPNRYLTAIIFSGTALLILLLLAATSFDWAMRVLGKRWKQLHRFVYAASILILVHALMLGSDFISVTSTAFRLSFLLVFVLLGMEAARIDRYLANRFSSMARAGLAVCLVISLASFILAGLGSNDSLAALSVHAGHIAAAQQAQVQATQTLPPLPGLNGDRTKRYSVSYAPPADIVPNQPATLHFHVTDAATGETVTSFSKFYDQYMHVIIVDDTLTYFLHVHPTFDVTTNDFVLTTTFPRTGEFHLYLDFQPFTAIEQAFVVLAEVGQGNHAVDSSVLTDTIRTKEVNGYSITLQGDGAIKAADASVGNAKLTFSLSKNDQPVTNLLPYLSAYGHLTLVNTDTFEFVHVHPLIIPASPTTPSGPTVVFVPLGLYGPLKPGTYRAFAEFNPDGNYTVAPFTITLQ